MPEITLYNGDCLQIMKEIPDKSIDLIICDLPYGCLAGGEARGKGKERLRASGLTGCSWDIKIDLEAFWKEVKRIRKSDHSPTIHFCTSKFGYDLIKSNESEFRYDLVWSKTNAVGFLSANKKPMASHEMIYVFSKSGAYYERIDLLGDFLNTNKGPRPVAACQVYNAFRNTLRPSNEGKRCVKSVIQFSNKKTKGGHPTQKPEDLYTFLIERYCPPGGTVLDPTFGSGNSVFTAYKLGRNAIGIEKDEVFYKKAEKRLETF